jgi:competence protein ComEC
LVRYLAGLAGPGAALWAAVVAGIGVAVCLLPRGLPGRWLGALLMVPALFWPVARPPEGTAWISVLDVGQGLATSSRPANTP